MNQQTIFRIGENMKVRDLAKAFAERHFERFSTLDKNGVIEKCDPTAVLIEINIHAPNLNHANVKTLQEIIYNRSNLLGFADQVAEFVELKKEEKGMAQAAVCNSPKKVQRRVSPTEPQRGGSPLQANHLMRVRTGDPSFENRETSESRLSPEQNNEDPFARDTTSRL